MDFWRLCVVALSPVLRILVIAVVGAFLAFDRIGILKKNVKKHLNTMVYFVFFPAYIYGILAKTITLKSFVMLWFMPINILLRYIIGATLGWLLTKIIRVPHHMYGVVLGCCAAGNMGSLPIIVVPAICRERSHPFGDMDVCYSKGLTYTSLTLAVGHTYAWSIVYNILRIYAPKNNLVKFDDCMESKETNPRALAPDEDKSFSIDKIEVECEVANVQEEVLQKPTFMKQVKIFADKINLKAIFAPTLLGAIIGMIIGIVPLFRKLLVGDTAPLHAIQTSIVMLGDAAIPATMLLVGANLLGGMKGFSRKLPLLLGTIAVQYIALPAIGIGIVKGAVHFNLISSDPLYQFVLMVHYAVPPAVAVSTMTQLLGSGQSECSLIMFATYSSAPVLLTLWWTVFMWLIL